MSRTQHQWNFEKPYSKDLLNFKESDWWHSLEEKYKKHFPLDDDDYVQNNTQHALGGLCYGTEVTELLQKVLKEHAEETQQKPIVVIRYQGNDDSQPFFFAEILRDGYEMVKVEVGRKFYEKITKEIEIDFVGTDDVAPSEADDWYEKWDKYCDACEKRLDFLISIAPYKNCFLKKTI